MEVPNILDCGHVEYRKGHCATLTCPNCAYEPLRPWTPIETLTAAVITRRAEVELKLHESGGLERTAYLNGIVGAFSEVLKLIDEVTSEQS